MNVVIFSFILNQIEGLDKMMDCISLNNQQHLHKNKFIVNKTIHIYYILSFFSTKASSTCFREIYCNHYNNPIKFTKNLEKMIRQEAALVIMINR